MAVLRGGVRVVVMLVMVVVMVVVQGDAEVCEKWPGFYTSSQVQRLCESVVVGKGSGTGTGTGTQLVVLKQLCLVGRSHVIAGTKQRRRKLYGAEDQFAVMNLHRDSFSDDVKWESGSAEDVACTEDWYVDEEVGLSNGYTWYRHGLPMWPFLYQAVPPKKKGIQWKKKKVFWPNYAFATPLYLVPYENNNMRPPNFSFGKLFLEKGGNGTFKKFQETVMEVCETVGKLTEPETCEHWISFLIHKSLPAMLKSFKKVQNSLCPDNLYLFFAKYPDRLNSSYLDLESILRDAGCEHTELIWGFSMAH